MGTDVVRLYDEFDRHVADAKAGKLSPHDKTTLLAAVTPERIASTNPINFRQAAGLGQSVDWNSQKGHEAEVALGNTFDKESIESRFQRARHWLEKYNSQSLMTVRDERNTQHISSMTPEAKAHVNQLYTALQSGISDLKEINALVYAIPKVSTASDEENKVLQRNFFKDVYQLLIGGDKGPRLSTLLWAMDRQRALDLLSV